MKKMIGIVGILLMSMTLNAHEVTVKITLSPAGGFEAKSAKLKGDIKQEAGKFTAENLWVKVEELKTDNGLRDEHFHKHLNFEKSPKITLTKVTAADGKGTGVLTVNEVQKPISFTYKSAGAKKLEATFKVKNSDFKLAEAKYMGIGVDDIIEIVAIVEI